MVELANIAILTETLLDSNMLGTLLGAYFFLYLLHFVSFMNIYSVDKYEYLKPEYMTFHVEIKESVKEMIQYIKNKGIKVGLSLKPDTSIETIKPYIDEIDLVLIMTVEPGKGGQKFIENMLPKIKQIKKLQLHQI